MRLMIITIFFLLPTMLTAQYEHRKLDSLHFMLKNAPNATVRMGTYMRLIWFYQEVNFDSALYYSNQSLPIAQQLKLRLHEADILDGRAYVYFLLTNYPKSLEGFLQALKIAEDPSSETDKSNIAIDQYKTAAIYRQKILSSIHHDLGHLYGRTGNISNQISEYKESEKIATSIYDTNQLALINMNMGWAYSMLDKIDSAIWFEDKSITFYSRLPFDNRKYEGLALSQLGDYYQRKGNYKEAIFAQRKSIAANQQHNNLNFLGDSYRLLAILFQSLQQPDSGLYYAQKALVVNKAVGFTRGIAEAYSLIAASYGAQQKTDSALSYLQKASKLKDSLQVVEKKNLSAFQNIGLNEQIRMEEMKRERISTQGKIKSLALLAGIAIFMLIAFLLFRNNRNRKKANVLLQQQKEELQKTLSDLKTTQSQLIQSEKMASLGELTAGIAHEIQNPLNFINNFSEVNIELINELKDEVSRGNLQEISSLAGDIESNSEKINYHGKRADAIVKGMLQHSRSSNGVKEPTDINALADEYLRLAYHGLRARDKSFNATMQTDFDKSISHINIIPQDIGRVILNLITNAFYVVDEKKKSGEENYEPIVTVSTKKINGKVEIKIADNGSGIPQKVLDKIFQPFFTTKPAGQGTGLGLSLSYDIVKAHGGKLKVETKVGEGSQFIIQLPA